MLTSRGYIPVERVKVGDLVITHEGRARRVSDIFINDVRPVLKTVLQNGLSLITTRDHAFYLADGSWRRADRLRAGDKVMVHSESEAWRTIKNWHRYEVSSWGRVRNKETGCVLTQRRHTNGDYLHVDLMRNGARKRGDDRKNCSVHRLVLEAFIGIAPTKECRHLNGIAWDNTLANLKWGTRQENDADARYHGVSRARRTAGGGVLYPREVIDAIRSTPYVRGNPGGRGPRSSDWVLAEKFAISRSYVRSIRLGEVRKPPLDNKVSFYQSKVRHISSMMEAQTYGLTVEEDHSHVTGGVVTHNCNWCKPKLGAPPDLTKLPAILEGRVLPPLSGKVDLRALYALAGFVLDDDRASVLSVVRVRVVQYTWAQHPLIRRCGAEVRFRDRGWREAAVFMETWLHRLVEALSMAEPRKPRALWSSLNAAMECRWSPPWVREGWP